MSKTLIQTITVGAGGAASIDFTNIPQTFTDLVVVASIRNGTGVGVQGGRAFMAMFNGSNSNRTARWLNGFGSSGVSSSTNDYFWATGSDSTANIFGNTTIYIPNYTASTNKSYSVDSTGENNSSLAEMSIGAHAWADSAAITSISIIPTLVGNIAQYSTASLYGVNKITPSGSGATPNVEYLVVAGGGGGGSTLGGGGGAGGLRTNGGLAVSSGSSITVTVGAGGAGGTGGGGNGQSGANSTFSSITSVGGGGGGGLTSVSAAGGSGGSGGGGAGGDQAVSGGAGTTGQGYAGYNGAAGQIGGGGGGASAAATGKNGANGIQSSMTGTAVYYAGGGGAGTNRDAGAPAYDSGTGGLGGGANGYYYASQGTAPSGLANTGGGGGGSGGNGGYSAGGAGGSGVVIIRYPDYYANPTATTGNPMVNYANGYKIYTWTNSGSITF